MQHKFRTVMTRRTVTVAFFMVAWAVIIYLSLVLALSSNRVNARALQAPGSGTSVASSSDSVTLSGADDTPIVRRRARDGSASTAASAVNLPVVSYPGLLHHNRDDFRVVHSDVDSKLDVQEPLKVYMYPLPRDLNMDLLLVVSAATRCAVW